MTRKARQRCRAEGHRRRRVVFLPERQPTRRLETCDHCGAVLARERIELVDFAASPAPVSPSHAWAA